MKSVFRTLVLLVIVVMGGFIFITYYPFIFSRKVNGVIESIQRIDMNVALLQQSGQDFNPQLFSFAVAIKDTKTGEIVTASAEDRQWAVASKGQCAQAVFYPYPPWNVMKSGTYYNARLDHLSDCSGGSASPPAPTPDQVPTQPAAPQPVATPTKP